MTNLEALRANISSAHGVVLTENHFVKALTDVGLVSSEDYVTGSEREIDLSTIMLYNQILGGAGLGEGGLTYNFQLSGVVAAKKALEDKWGVTPQPEPVDPKNTIESVSAW